LSPDYAVGFSQVSAIPNSSKEAKLLTLRYSITTHNFSLFTLLLLLLLPPRLCFRLLICNCETSHPFHLSPETHWKKINDANAETKR